MICALVVLLDARPPRKVVFSNFAASGHGRSGNFSSMTSLMMQLDVSFLDDDDDDDDDDPCPD